MRIGILGGTFDPPHVGHMILASEALEQLNLERLFFLLTPISPLKEAAQISPLAQRLLLLQTAIAPDLRFGISRIDIDRPPPHYAADTMQLIHEKYPDEEVFHVMGADSLHDLPTWHDPERFVRLCDGIGVMRRPQEEIDLDDLSSRYPGLRDKLHFIEAPLLEISATEIRHKIRTGGAYRYYLLQGVYDLIRREGYYQPGS